MSISVKEELCVKVTDMLQGRVNPEMSEHEGMNKNMKHIVKVAKATTDYPRKSEGDIIELKDGRLMIVYMEFGGEGDDFATTRLVIKESADGGLSWIRNRVLTETLPGDVNVYSPNLIRSLNGEILLVFMRKHTKEPRTLTTFYVWKSIDEGESFQPHSEFVKSQEFTQCNAVIKRSRQGRLLMPLSVTVEAGQNCYSHSYAGALYYSDDDGLTWKESVNRIFLPMRGVMEMHVEETRDEKLLMVMRNQLGGLFVSESTDNGISWSKPQTTGLRTPESCPELTRMPATGDLLMIWNNSPYDPAFTSHYGKRSPLTAAISKDEGLTWINIRNIEDCPRHAYSNPGCRFTSYGTAIINYWTCEYTQEWRMQHKIDLRVAVIESEWFYS